MAATAKAVAPEGADNRHRPRRQRHRATLGEFQHAVIGTALVNAEIDAKMGIAPLKLRGGPDTSLLQHRCGQVRAIQRDVARTEPDIQPVDRVLTDAPVPTAMPP